MHVIAICAHGKSCVLAKKRATVVAGKYVNFYSLRDKKTACGVALFCRSKLNYHVLSIGHNSNVIAAESSHFPMCRCGEIACREHGCVVLFSKQ